MTPEQRLRLQLLIPAMEENRRFLPTMNELRKADRMLSDLKQALMGNHGPDAWTPEQWLAYAERAARPPAEKIIRSLSMAQISSGMPPEHFSKEA